MSQSGCATVLLLWQRDLMELSDAQRVMCEKVYGALLAVKGPLRAQQGLRSQVIDVLDRSPQMYLHGARLYVAMVSGLPFISVAPRMRDLAKLRFNQVMAFTLQNDETTDGVRELLRDIEMAMLDVDQTDRKSPA